MDYPKVCLRRGEEAGVLKGQKLKLQSLIMMMQLDILIIWQKKMDG